MHKPAAPEAYARLALAGLSCALTVVAGFALREWLDGPNLVMLFLLNVVVAARWLGRNAAVLCAFLDVAAFDFFFVPPHLSFAVSDLQYLWTFGVMLFVALLIVHLTTGLRQTALDAEARAVTATALYRFSRQLGRAATQEQLVTAAGDCGLVVPGLACRAYLRGPEDRLLPLGEVPALEGLELMAAQAALLATGPRLTPHLTPDDRPLLLLPLRGSARALGVLLATPESGSRHELQQHQATLESIAVLLAATIERLVSVAASQQGEVAIATERLRNSILAAISHDLRTPLATLFGAADALLLEGRGLPTAQREHLHAIHAQALHLNTMVGNLLELARLHGDDFQLRREWQPFEEVVGTSLKLLGPALEDHPVTLALAPDLPLLEFDAVLIERVLCNLLDNAIRHAPAGSAITLEAAVSGAFARIGVRNTGSQLTPASLAALRAADTYAADAPAADGAPSRGLGLSICKAIVTAHGGVLEAINDDDAVCVRFTLPLGSPPIMPPDPDAPGEPAPEQGP